MILGILNKYHGAVCAATGAGVAVVAAGTKRGMSFLSGERYFVSVSASAKWALGVKTAMLLWFVVFILVITSRCFGRMSANGLKLNMLSRHLFIAFLGHAILIHFNLVGMISPAKSLITVGILVAVVALPILFSAAEP